MENYKPSIEACAFMFQAEGCVCVRLNQVSLTIGMTDPEICNIFYELFGGSVSVESRKGRSKNCTRWGLYGQQASNLAKLFLPYTIIPRKAEALRCLIEWCTTLCKPGEILSKEDSQKRLDLSMRCRKLNKKGK